MVFRNSKSSPKNDFNLSRLLKYCTKKSITQTININSDFKPTTAFIEPRNVWFWFLGLLASRLRRPYWGLGFRWFMSARVTGPALTRAGVAGPMKRWSGWRVFFCCPYMFLINKKTEVFQTSSFWGAFIIFLKSTFCWYIYKFSHIHLLCNFGDVASV